VAIIIPANSAADTAYEVANSCRFNDGDSAYLSRTLGTPTDNNVWTFSFWIKRGILGSAMQLFDSDTGSGDEGYLMINAGNDPAVNIYDSAGNTAQFNISRRLRDPSAWMHIVWNFNSGDSTAGDRMQIWYNGVRGTDFTTNTQPALNDGSTINEAKAHRIGAKMNDSRYFDGYLAEVVFIDGSALAPTSFGEFDEDSPTIWKPKDVSGLTFGDNGFYLDFEDSSALGNDVSGNNNDWTANNLAAADQATDTPTNNFCVMNPLGGQTAATSNNSWSLAEGNMSFVSGNAYSQWITGTMSISAGKWYWELQPQGTFGTSDNVPYVGIIKTTEIGARQALTSTTSASNDTITMEANGDKVVLGTTSAGYGDTFTNDDKLMMAVDCDNGKVWWGVNGTWQKSGAVGDPANGTNANATFTAGTEFVPYCLGWSGDATPINYNFGGCPAFTVSSAAQDENGYGRFEFSPPDSFLSLCSKNLGSDGG